METYNPTSSVGAVWPPQISQSSERMRGFYDQAIISLADASEFIEAFYGYCSMIHVQGLATRLAVRGLMSLPALRHIHAAGVGVEGVLPLAATDELAVVYAGWNAPERTVDSARLAQHNQLLQTIATAPRVHRSANLETAAFRVVDSSLPSAERSSLTPAFTELYAQFGYTPNDVRQLLASPLNTIVYTADERGVTSTAMAEQAVISVGGYGDVRLIEITEAATRKDMRGQGLYRQVSGFLLQHVLAANDVPRVDALYGESNLAMPNVIRAAHNNNRRFSRLDATLLGVEQAGFGILLQNVAVNDGVELRTYNDFALSYVPLSGRIFGMRNK